MSWGAGHESILLKLPISSELYFYIIWEKWKSSQTTFRSIQIEGDFLCTRIIFSFPDETVICVKRLQWLHKRAPSLWKIPWKNDSIASSMVSSYSKRGRGWDSSLHISYLGKKCVGILRQVKNFSGTKSQRESNVKHLFHFCMFGVREKTTSKHVPSLSVISKVLLVSIIKNAQAPKLIENRISKLAGAELQGTEFWRHDKLLNIRGIGWRKASIAHTGVQACEWHAHRGGGRWGSGAFFKGCIPCTSTNSQGTMTWVCWLNSPSRKGAL